MGLDMALNVNGVELIDWRKSNMIHKWFVDNVQNGNDDCNDYPVTIDNLKELISVIDEILGITIKEKIVHSLKDGFDKEKAEELLPTQSGFFFGSTDYDEYYLEDLKRTQKVLKTFLEGLNEAKIKDLKITYWSSW